MIHNETIPECWRCDRQEQQGAESFRQTSNREWGISHQVLEYPQDWEIQITNLCNLRCLMCNAWSSSQVLQENNAIFGITHDQKDYDWNPEQIDQVRKMFLTGQSFVIRGGEPFIVPWLRDMVDEITDRKSFLINTNATKFDEHWFDILSRHNVKMSISIDGYQSLNHYIRYPSEWDQIVRNIETMRRLPDANLFLNTCVQNLNVLGLDRLLIWAHEQRLFVNLDTLTYPRYFEPACFPQDLLDQALTRLMSLPTEVKNNTQGLDSVLAYLDRSDLTHWTQFQEYVISKDKYRKQNILDHIPELENYF